MTPTTHRFAGLLTRLVLLVGVAACSGQQALVTDRLDEVTGVTTMKMELLAGRDYSEDYPVDSAQSIIINESPHFKPSIKIIPLKFRFFTFVKSNWN